MSTHKPQANQRPAGRPSPEGEDNNPTSPWRRAGKVTVAILTPWPEITTLYRRAVLPGWQHLRRIRELVSARQRTGQERLGWAQAVAATGLTAEQLVRNFRRLRAAWWCLMALTGLLATMLLLMLLAAGNSLPAVTAIRAVVALLVLLSLAGVGGVKTLVATWRLWQLTERRVSRAERGTLRRFLAENRWGRQVLTLGICK